MASRDIELESISHPIARTGVSTTPDESGTQQADSQPEDGRQEFSLPPVDGGKDAWLFLAACFAIEALVWGFPFAFGVFQDYYSTHEPFAGSPNVVVIGTCAVGIMYLTAPLMMGLCRIFARWARWTSIVGLFTMCLALAMSSFSSKISHLIATQGVLYAIGGGIAYCPCILYIDEWFVQRKGLAYGIMWSGTGLAGVVLPLLMEFLLRTVGFRTTLRIWSGVLFALTIPLAFYIKPRLPYSATSHVKPFNLNMFLMPTFWLYQLANVIEAMGFFLPGIYLPNYARSALGAASYGSVTTLLLVNVASVFGCVAMGFFIDRFHVTTCILLSTLGATIGALVIWGLSSSLPLLYFFCVVYGLFAGSYTSAWPGVMADIVRKGEALGQGYIDPSMVFGWLAAGRGIGNVVSGPLSENLIQSLPWKGNTAPFGYSSGYGSLIVFTGVTALLGEKTLIEL
ncbi:MFS general substrate transporter [Daldinia loculata]|uniref:MFS general substrate transporter n=1 Tax=Daldinia loculata TaxID=103429 RepID=UPI0020C28595|nr:MFS general substrate transporter [Daldinia loculata]KAI1649211.1 MFS general substrate transporter [Daldinia loculata]